jgi:galactokinase
MTDTEAFINLLSNLKRVSPETSDLFSADEVIVTRAPGRIDVMGGIADYSGSLVLQSPIAAATHVAIQVHEEPVVRIHRLSVDAERSLRKFEMPLRALMPGEAPISYATAHAMFKRDPKDAWAAYVAGAFLVLMRERCEVFSRGSSIFIASAGADGWG